MTETVPMSWKIRRWVWNSISLIIFRLKKAEKIPLPPDSQAPLKPVPLAERIPGITIRNILMADRIPADEASKKMAMVFRFRLWLYKVFPANQPGLPQIHADMDKAMDTAFTRHYAALYPRPERPEAFRTEGAPDLGTLAVASPYACFLERSKDGIYHWDFRDLDGHEIYDGLRPIGCRVIFEADEGARRLKAARIDSVLGSSAPGAADWEAAVALALCAASTQISLVRHFNWVHLACGGPFAIATRNRLPGTHPLCRLVWPHMFGTQNSNYLVTMGQMLRGGDFETVFSFTHAGMCDLFERTFNDYRASVIVPRLDWAARGLPEGVFDTPVQDNLCELYDVMHAHAARYIAQYYDSDDALRADAAAMGWIDDLNRLIPNGVDGILQGTPTRDGLARLVGGLIYMASVQHEELGSFMWNYQMWVDKSPVRIREDGRRVPLDVFQRLLNANFNLNVDRALLMQDLSYFGLDAAGAGLFRQFETELRALENRLSAEPPALWRIKPSRLDANINA